MLSQQSLAWGQTKSCIRELMEFGMRRKAEIGADKVFDYSIGNPSIPAPACVKETIAELLEGDSIALHGYTPAAGLPPLRKLISEKLNERYALDTTAANIYVTCGAAAGLAIALKAMLLSGEEVITSAPFFPEYRVFTEACGGKLVALAPDKSFMIDTDALKAALNEKTKAIIVNSPNNPSGAILSEDNLKAVAEILREHKAKTGRTVYIISDEPYRELVYDGTKVHCALEYYDDTVFCYSFSKTLSLPGERIGYLAVSSKMTDAKDMINAIAGAGRSLGYVNAPSMFQQVILRCFDAVSDVSKYRENRDLLCSIMDELGYEYIMPQGAFYLFVKALEPDAKSFSEQAKKHELLLVPSDDFGVGGYVRLAYCVSKEMIEASKPAFAALKKDYE
ncbi:MAG: pyridoxal phosphate-dependent aminotransferase [Eubacteriales bacterium]|nr:pyridoxal phosphate-dependent aminotransferase [Eubacteriales bacterium]